MIDSLPVVKFLRDATIARQYQKVEKMKNQIVPVDCVILLHYLIFCVQFSKSR